MQVLSELILFYCLFIIDFLKWLREEDFFVFAPFKNPCSYALLHSLVPGRAGQNKPNCTALPKTALN